MRKLLDEVNKNFRPFTVFYIIFILNAVTDHWVFVNYAEHPVRAGFINLIPSEVFMVSLITASFGSIKIADDYLSTKWKNEKLQRESLSAELKFLKAQLHPH